MDFLESIYLGETLSYDQCEIMKKLNTAQNVPNLYLIVLPYQSPNMLELIPEDEILQNGYPKDAKLIVGAANGKKEAFGLVKRMVEDAFAQTGKADAKEFFMKMWEEQSCR